MDPLNNFEELELARLRYQTLGYIAASVPVNTAHARLLVTQVTPSLQPDLPSLPLVATSSKGPADESGFPLLLDKSSIDVQLSEASTEPKLELPTQILTNDVSQVILMYSKAADICFRVTTTLDTGCNDNWISEKIAIDLQLKPKRELVTTYYMFNGKTFKSDQTVSIDWCFADILKTRNSVFRILESTKPPFDVLLGGDLLVSERIVSIDKNPKQSKSALVLVTKKITEEEQAEIEKNKRKAAAESATLAAQRKQSRKQQTTATAVSNKNSKPK